MFQQWTPEELFTIWQSYLPRHEQRGCETGKFAFPTSGDWDPREGFPITPELRAMIIETSCMYTHLTDLVMAGWN